MAPEAPPNARVAALDRVPDHVLFPDAYRRTARMIRADFAFYGGTLVAFLLAIRLAEWLVVGQ